MHAGNVYCWGFISSLRTEFGIMSFYTFFLMYSSDYNLLDTKFMDLVCSCDVYSFLSFKISGCDYNLYWLHLGVRQI